MFCQQCGSKSLDGAEFCQQCGAKLTKDEPKHTQVTETACGAYYLIFKRHALEHTERAGERFGQIAVTKGSVAHNV